MKTLIIIPTYNEKQNIKKLLKEINQLKLKNLDILIIDDNSPDKTAEIVAKLQQKYQNLFLIKRSGKLGLGSAYITGFNWAIKRDYDYIFEMDADFSHAPKDIPRLLNAAQSGADLAIGSRRVKGGKIIGWNWQRHLSSFGANKLAKILLGLKTRDATAGFRCFRAQALKKLDLNKIKSNGYAFQEEMVYLFEKNNFKIKEVPVTFKDRAQGKSKLGKKQILEFFQVIFMLKFFKYKKIIKFCVVGISGAIIDFTALICLVELFSVPILIANGFAFSLAVINNFIWNKTWTFRNTEKKYLKQFSQFVIIALIGLSLNILLMHLFVSIGLHYTLAKIIIVFIVGAWNFLTNKYWTFKLNNNKSVQF